MTRKIFSSLIIVIIICFCLCVYLSAQSEEVQTITTYYPSPQGIYYSVRLYPNRNPPACDAAHQENEGLLHYNDVAVGTLTNIGLYYCNGNQWQFIGGSGTDLNWTLFNDQYLHTNDPAWNVGIGTQTPLAKLHVENGAVMFTQPRGIVILDGPGTRFIWGNQYPSIAAGGVDGSQWDDDIGISMGWNPVSTPQGISLGYGTEVQPWGIVALGFKTRSSGGLSMGYQTNTEDADSVAMGYQTTATGGGFAMGNNTVADDTSIAIGSYTTANPTSCVAMGYGTASSPTSCAADSIALGYNVHADSGYVDKTALGYNATASHYRSFVIGINGSNCLSEQNGQFKLCGNLKVRNDGVAGYGNIDVEGELSCSGGKFEMPHPDPNKPEGTLLRHSSIEGPTAGDNLYRWTVSVKNKIAIIQLPDYYKYLNKDDMVWVYPAKHFGNAYGEVDDKQETLTIHADTDGDYHVILIGTRKDKLATEHWQGPEEYVEPSS